MATSPIPAYNLKQLVETDMLTILDKSIVSSILSKPPFTPLPGALNLRDLGLLPSVPIRPGLIYRSGALSSLPPSSFPLLRNTLGITLILDLRTPREIERAPYPVIEGVENWSLKDGKPPSPVEMERFVEEGGKKAYVEMYGEVLEIYGEAVRKGLGWIRDEMGGLLVGCTAGKDRTGVLAAVILGLAGVPKEVIAYDYALTRVGIEPARDLLMAMLKMWNKDWSLETPGMAEFSQVKAEFMLGTLEMIEQKYGGVEGYVKGYLGFSDEDVERIRKALRGE